ncbi:MAG TPA: YceI family protein [Thermoanaerobaculia bacterium]|nr:YceI family protein [Thermoanaerobaculia bacterium]
MSKIFAAVLALSLLAAADIPPARIDLVGAEIYSIDQGHSLVGFDIDFLGLSTVHGTFNDYQATILYDEAHPERSSATVLIDAASINTNSQFRDRDLKSDKFFDVAKYPQIRFQSTRIERKGANDFVVHGNLTIKDVTKEIALPMKRTVSRRADSAWGNIRIGGTGSVRIQRKDFHVDSGSVAAFAMLADDVDIHLEVLGNRFNYDKWSWTAKEKPSIGEAIFQTATEKDGTAAAAQLRNAKATDYTLEPGQVGIAVNRLMQRRRVADALAILEAALELWPNEPGFHARAGEAYATLGRRDDAVREYEKASALNPRGTEAMEMLRRLRSASGS